MIVVASALISAAPAQAAPDDPAPPPAPAPFVPQQTGIGNPLAQSGTGPGGLLRLPNLSAYGSNMLLGQNPAPAAPDAPAASVVPNLSAFNPEYLLGQNLTPAAPGEGVAAPGLGPDQDSPGTGRIAFLRRIYEMYQDGALKGSLLGQQSPEEFAGQGIAPPPPAG
jgi:hypothetical protein